jgi:FKBP-type peptidyl-prolyl cis-trans isomerase
MISRVILIIVMIFTIPACRDVPDKQKNKLPGTNDMEDLNVYFVKKDKERIQNYIDRRNLSMKESPTGLWYQISKEGEGEYFRDSDRVIYKYDCSLLDGTKCYSSDELGPKEAILGRTELEAGLYEGFRMLKPGAEAVFILPPWLAYGFVGDRNKIPPRAVIVYSVTILPSK